MGAEGWCFKFFLRRCNSGKSDEDLPGIQQSRSEVLFCEY